MAAPVLAVVGAGGGCGGSSTPPASRSDAEALCPATIAQTADGACTETGLVCGPSYPCGATDVPLLCVCDGRIFQCTDGAGKTIHGADEVSCPAPIDGGSSCPRTERSAQLAPCGAPGLLCAYPSACTSTFDQCECFPGATADGGFGLRFECRPSECSTSDAAAAEVDGGAPSEPDADSGARGDSASLGPDVDSAGPTDASLDQEGSAAEGASLGEVGASTDASNETQSFAGDARPE